MANALRGQIELVIGDKTFLLKPTFEVLASLENELGKSIYGILTDLSNPRTSKVGDVAKVIHIASGKKESVNTIGELIVGQGPHKCLTTVFEFLSRSIASDQELEDAKKKIEGESNP